MYRTAVGRRLLISTYRCMISSTNTLPCRSLGTHVCTLFVCIGIHASITVVLSFCTFQTTRLPVTKSKWWWCRLWWAFILWWLWGPWKLHVNQSMLMLGYNYTCTDFKTGRSPEVYIRITCTCVCVMCIEFLLTISLQDYCSHIAYGFKQVQ